MSSIDTRSSFFPRTTNKQTKALEHGTSVDTIQKNSPERASQIVERTSSDAKVTIPDGVKDFSKIKKAALNAPEHDNSEKIARLKAQIQAGAYEVDYDALADKILTSEF